MKSETQGLTKVCVLGSLVTFFFFCFNSVQMTGSNRIMGRPGGRRSPEVQGGAHISPAKSTSVDPGGDM